MRLFSLAFAFAFASALLTKSTLGRASCFETSKSPAMGRADARAPSPQGPGEASGFSTHFAVAPRLSIARFIGPWFALGAFASIDAVSRDDAAFGIFARASIRAFDGVHD